MASTGSVSVSLASLSSQESTVAAIYFAWVDPDDTTFIEAFKREDEQIIAFAIEHEEGQFPTLSITVKRLASGGYLAPSRQRWAWLAYDDGVVTTPLFFGRIVGFPQEISGEVVRLDFVARPLDWFRLKSAAAESLKVAPFYDPIWIAPDKRTDPDVVLEARPERWHVDRVTHAITTSNILAGEDGTVDIDGEYFYDSLRVSYGQVAGRRITIQAQVNWTQRAEGSLNLTNNIQWANWLAGSTSPWLMTSFTGEGLIRDWPKAGQSIGGGWTFGPSYPLDRTGLSLTAALDLSLQDGNRMRFPLWAFIPYVIVEYKANRARIERVVFTMDSDVQDLATDPGDEEILTLSLSSQDIGQPIDLMVTPPAWQATTAYRVNAFVTSNGAIYRCISPGTSGTVAPTDVSATIQDGTCIWSWVTFESQIDMQTFVPPWTPSTAYGVGDVVQNGGFLYECSTAGTSAAAGGPAGFQTLQWQPDASYFANDVVVNNGLYYIALNDGISGAQGPAMFSVFTWDGSVQWLWLIDPSTVIGQINDGTCKWRWRNDGMPIGDLGRRQYFTTDRGKRSIDYLLCLARARLLARARSVSISFTIPFADGIDLSCRKSASIADPRIPGGTATGKVTGYRLTLDAQSGKAVCDVTIGCAVGKGGTAAPVAGEAIYVADGYVDTGYQQEEGGQVNPDGIADLTYSQFETTPVYDDGIDFTAFGPNDAILQLNVINNEVVQATAMTYIGEHFKGFIDATEVLQKYPTMVDLYLKPVTGGQFQTDYALVVTNLKIPQDINLEAEA